LLTFYRKGALFSIPFGFYWIINTPEKVYIIPLPHPSTANNKYWQENQCWEQLKELLKMCV
ncbi:hypothetical protein ABS784_16855, partial [Geobacillus sp. G4]|uniref:hypothetical protein n=1 Tax=Geobacillus sp. G4 TaxID=3169691 RepID=UPI00333C03FD